MLRLRRNLAWLLAPALLLAVGTPCISCGLHATYFRNDFFDDWQRLKPQVEGDLTLRNKGTQAYAIVQELITLLRFVDPYNGAPDSPPWMASEAGREHACESAVTILHQIGAKAVPALWEALENDLRFTGDNAQKALAAAREARNEVLQAQAAILTRMNEYPKLKAVLEGYAQLDSGREVLQGWARLVAEGRIPQLHPNQPVPEGGAAKAVQHRPMAPEQWTKAISLQLLVNFDAQMGLLSQDPEAQKDPKIAELHKAYRDAQNKALQHMNAYNQAMAGARTYVTVAYDMLPCEEYHHALKTVLARIGKDALPVLKARLNHPNRKVAAAAQELVKSIEAQTEPLRVPELKPLGGDRSARIVEVALEAWDLGAPPYLQHVSDKALKALKARGEAGWADLVTVMAIDELGLKAECRHALEVLTGGRGGDAAAAWKKWIDELAERKREQAEAERIAAVQQMVDDMEIEIEPRPGAREEAEAREKAEEEKKSPKAATDKLIDKLKTPVDELQKDPKPETPKVDVED